MSSSLKTISIGRPTPLGATLTSQGANFALFSAHATNVELLLFKPKSRLPFKTLKLSPTKNRTGNIWHILVPNIAPYTRYAYRVDGPKTVGNRFDHKKILLDPYAKAFDNQFYQREQACYADDNLLTSLRGIILPKQKFSWADDHLPKIPLAQTVIYELHVRGFTKDESSGCRFPGTFAGLTEKLAYLKDLGVTSLELMPINAFDDDLPWQNSRGEELINYWGYSPLSYFALQPSYFSQQKNTNLNEFKTLVKEAHRLNLEIILDVVYNHTTEANHTGPTLSWRGIDNQSYYSLSPADRNYNLDFTGCGNTLRTNYPPTSKMIVDSLEYLAQEFHVDGFRFDLGAIFYYENERFVDQPAIIKLINESPILRNLKLIAEPWDATGLVLQGRFGGDNWLEWNGAFRDRLRKLINFNQEEKDFAAHLAGKAPEFTFYHKDPRLSVNFITAHDGFTLRDLVSYNQPHNWDNGFHNTDGQQDNSSFNYGAEGETSDQNIQVLRQEKAQAMLTYLLLAPGVPMVLMGDEMWRTQNGNNNAFSQDNQTSWLNWHEIEQNRGWWEKCRNLIRQRSQEEP
ncbi:MAG: isoamylase [bacterium]|nr:isoamylase [bacterium]